MNMRIARAFAIAILVFASASIVDRIVVSSTMEIRDMSQMPESAAKECGRRVQQESAARECGECGQRVRQESAARECSKRVRQESAAGECSKRVQQ